jgi:hypothetical protein
MAKISITIDKQGKPTIDAKGFVGGKCADATKGYLSALGATDTKEEVKPEMYQTNDGIDNNQQIGGGNW